jgi:hypothetical protein
VTRVTGANVDEIDPVPAGRIVTESVYQGAVMSDEPTPEPLEHPAKPEQPEGGFAEGQEMAEDFPENERVGRFSEGEEELPDTPEKDRHGRFSEGQEDLPEEDPEKHEEGRFSEGQDEQPPGVTP